MKNLKEIKNNLDQLSSNKSEILSTSVLKSVKGGTGDPPPYIEAF